MEFVLGYVAGLLTLINPCVLPVLPIVLATALQAGRSGPLLLAFGMSVSFVTFGLLIAALGQTFGISEESLSNAAAVVMIAFGLVLYPIQPHNKEPKYVHPVQIVPCHKVFPLMLIALRNKWSNGDKQPI